MGRPGTERPLRIAIVKMSSMGDVIHAMPVVTDLLREYPDARIDWVVEEGFADLARLHPGVNEVLPVALRRWRKAWRERATWAAARAARRDFAARQYDVVLDLQGLVKSAWVASWLDGERVGYARACAREPLASFAYRHRFEVDMKTHAIEKMRSLAAQALDYAPQGLPVFSLAPPPRPRMLASGSSYRVFLHATSRAEKLWPAPHWVALLREARAQGRQVYLPWGSEVEKAAAFDLADAAGHGCVLSRLSLAECAGLLAHAEVVVGVDTGLTHLSAALDTPTVALFAATESWRYGPYWTDRAVSLGADGQWPDADAVTAQVNALLAQAA